MKKQLFALSILTLTSFAAVAQSVTGTVSIGPNYADQKWYSLENGVVATQSKDNWDIAFEITGYSSAILANTQKTGFAIYAAPFSIANYAILDTVGISGWGTLYNSDTTWTIGAFNKGADLSDATDLGWGVYNMSTHIVSGDSCYVLKLSATSYKKLKIESLSGGVYTFVYADINGANSFTQTIAKSNYTGKNFAYFNLTSNAAVDREPVSANWDLTFGKYTAILMAPNPTPYGVSGIMANKGVSVVQANNVTSPLTYNNWSSQTFSTNITTIGHDWKAFDLTTNAWKIVNDTVYFVSDKAGIIWKLKFLSFGGATTGDFVFSKEKMQVSTVGIAGNSQHSLQMGVYPNPTSGSNTTLIFSNTNNAVATISVVDMHGKTVSNESIQVSEGTTSHELKTMELSTGIYFVKLNAGTYSAVQKLIIQ